MKIEEDEGRFGLPQKAFKPFNLHVDFRRELGNPPENYCSLSAFSVLSTA